MVSAAWKPLSNISSRVSSTTCIIVPFRPKLSKYCFMLPIDNFSAVLNAKTPLNSLFCMSFTMVSYCLDEPTGTSVPNVPPWAAVNYWVSFWWKKILSGLSLPGTKSGLDRALLLSAFFDGLHRVVTWFFTNDERGKFWIEISMWNFGSGEKISFSVATSNANSVSRALVERQ